MGQKRGKERAIIFTHFTQVECFIQFNFNRNQFRFQALKLSKTALGDASSGKIVNLLSNDVSRFDMVSVTIHQMWTAPLAALIVMYVLYTQAGYAGVVGVLVVFIVVPLQSKTSP